MKSGLILSCLAAYHSNMELYSYPDIAVLPHQTVHTGLIRGIHAPSSREPPLGVYTDHNVHTVDGKKKQVL